MPEAHIEFEVVWPLGRRHANRVEAVPPIGALNKKRIALIWDYRFKGDQMFEMVKEYLSARYPDVEYLDHQVFGNIHGPDEDELINGLPEKLRALEVDGAIISVGA